MRIVPSEDYAGHCAFAKNFEIGFQKARFWTFKSEGRKRR